MPIKNIYTFGATSTIAQETLKNFANQNCNFFLVARDIQKLNVVKKDLISRGANNVELYECDALESERHLESFEIAIEKLGNIDLVFIAHGTLPNNDEVRKNNVEVIKQFNINAVSVISLCTCASNIMESQGFGTIAVISSVAGDRGRQSNFIYGAAKGAINRYLQGLRNTLYPKGVKVITIKPGMVDTPMTEEFEKGLLFADAKKVGKSIFKSINAGKDIVYIPSIWKYIMLVIKLIPESIFKKLKL